MTKRIPLAVALAAFAMACSDPTSPTPSRILEQTMPSLDVSTVTGYPFVGIVDGQVQLCKTANVTGTFAFTASGGGAAPITALVTNPSITIDVAGETECVVIYRSSISQAAGAETITITENANAVPLTNIDVIQFLDPAVCDAPFPCGAQGASPYRNDAITLASRQAVVKINNDMARRVTFTNTFTPPTPTCTYTKGWYRNNGSSTVIAVDGRTIAQAQAIFAATPGQPGSVTWGVDNKPNNLLNLYQQLLAALNNLGGNATAGPAAVDVAIAAALAGTGGTGLNITTTLTEGQISSLIGTLSDFNEGTFAGWPHCDD